nr:NAD-dependent epimerase/dehydratase family protein [uncultured Blautia sp.]
MKILVLGKNGYVSRCFQEYMNNFSDQVDAISVREEQWKNFSFSGYDVVFNTIGLAHNDARSGTDKEFMELNVHLVTELAKKAKENGVAIFIHMSSMIVYGNSSEVGKFIPITEETVPAPDNIYGKSKLLGEKELKKLEDDSFKVALIRSSRVYGEKDTDSIQMLTKFAKKIPIFPKIENCISMIYSDNLCELVRLIAESKQEGIYFPQQEQYICTSDMVKDIAVAAGHKLCSTRIFNPLLLKLGKKVGIVRKVFGNEGFDLELSNHFEGKYRVISYEESIRKLAQKRD